MILVGDFSRGTGMHGVGADESHEKFEQDDDQPDFSGTYSK